MKDASESDGDEDESSEYDDEEDEIQRAIEASKQAFVSFKPILLIF